MLSISFIEYLIISKKEWSKNNLNSHNSYSNGQRNLIKKLPKDCVKRFSKVHKFTMHIQQRRNGKENYLILKIKGIKKKLFTYQVFKKFKTNYVNP